MPLIWLLELFNFLLILLKLEALRKWDLSMKLTMDLLFSFRNFLVILL